MSRRDNYQTITTRDEALQWLEEFRHTISDEAVLRVIEVLESNEALQAKQSKIEDLEHELEEVSDHIEIVMEAAAEWSGYVTEDHAPRTLTEHLRKALDEA